MNVIPVASGLGNLTSPKILFACQLLLQQLNSPESWWIKQSLGRRGLTTTMMLKENNSCVKNEQEWKYKEKHKQIFKHKKYGMLKVWAQWGEAGSLGWSAVSSLSLNIHPIPSHPTLPSPFPTRVQHHLTISKFYATQHISSLFKRRPLSVPFLFWARLFKRAYPKNQIYVAGWYRLKYCCLKKGGNWAKQSFELLFRCLDFFSRF